MRIRDIKWFLVALIALTILFLIMLFFHKVIAVTGIVSTWLVGGLALSLFYKRNLRVKELSRYVKEITLGKDRFDFRDHAEGELSILKSDLYKVTTMLRHQSERLSDEKRLLADYLSDISHQLKTPLTSIMMMSDLLKGQHLPEAKRFEFHEQMDTQLERIQWLVTSLLKLSKLDADTVVFKKDKIILKALIEKATLPILILMELKEQALVIDIDEHLTFVGDENWMTEALTNILKNCAEHTPKGGQIRVSTYDNPIYTAIVIEDNGKGIDKADLPRIFQRFYKGKNASDESVGIGLAMAYSIIKKQGGDIVVTSEVGKGSTFTIKRYKL